MATTERQNKRHSRRSGRHKTGKGRRKPWITDEMLETMWELRKWKNSCTQKGKKNCRRLNNELRRTTDKAKENWWKEQCEELEELEKKGRNELIYQKVKSLTNKRTRNTTKVIKDKQGKELTDPKEKENLWKECIEELYDKECKPTEDQLDLGPCIEDQEGPHIMKSEFEEALKKFKNKKAEGIDDISA